MKNVFKLRIFDVRLLGMVALALFILSRQANREPGPKLGPSRILRGEYGVQVTSLAISPTGRRIATTNSAGRIILRAPEGGWLIERSLDFPEYTRAVEFSPDGRTLVAVGGPPGIWLCDLTSATSQSATFQAIPIQRATRATFSPDGQSLAVMTDVAGTIVLWDLARGRERMVLRHPSRLASIAFSPDGRWLAAGGMTHRLILLWDLQTGSRQTLLEDRAGEVTTLAFSPDGTQLASASFPEHHVRLWDLNTRRVCRVFAGHTHTVNSVAFSPDGLLLATAGNDAMLGVWTVATGQRRLSLDGQATCLRTVAFSPDGRTLVLATEDDDDIRLWDLANLL